MQKQLRIAARAVIKNASHILLVKNKENNFFFLPGGGLEAGEPLEDCLKRELQEELGLIPAIGSLLGCIENHYTFEGKHYQEFNFLFHIPHGDQLLQEKLVSPEAHMDLVITPIDQLTHTQVFPIQLANFFNAVQHNPSYLFENRIAH